MSHSPESGNSNWPKPGLRDWALLTIGALFVCAGLFILPRDRNTGLVTLAFFGCCTAVFASTIVRKLRARKLAPLKAECPFARRGPARSSSRAGRPASARC